MCNRIIPLQRYQSTSGWKRVSDQSSSRRWFSGNTAGSNWGGKLLQVWRGLWTKTVHSIPNSMWSADAWHEYRQYRSDLCWIDFRFPLSAVTKSLSYVCIHIVRRFVHRNMIFPPLFYLPSLLQFSSLSYIFSNPMNPEVRFFYRNTIVIKKKFAVKVDS